MLNKKKAQTWVKVVAWMLAISFGLSLALMAIPVGTRTATTQPAAQTPKPLTPTTKADPGAAAQSAVGQGELALKNKQTDQAVTYFEQALKLDGKDRAIKGKLGDAYFTQGTEYKSKDKLKAKAAFDNYLKLLPAGPRAGEARSALADFE